MWMKRRASAEAPRAFGFFRPLALLLCLLVALPACNRENATQPPSEEPTVQPEYCDLKAPYSAADSLNPYFCTTQMNAALTSLMYSGLFQLEQDMSIKPRAAVSYIEGTRSVRVTLPSGGVFSDGTAITSADVVYSYQKAKSAAAYSGALAGVSGAVADSPLEVTFSFSHGMAAGVNLLTFPIVKNMTAESAENIPIGSGKYIIAKNGGQTVLQAVANQAVGQLRSITLVPVTDSAKLLYYLQTGEIDFFCSDLYGDRISRSGAKMYTVPTNNLLFLGVNSDSYALQFANVRKAVSLAVNREEIADSVYSGNAVAAAVPIRPGTKGAGAVDAAGETPAVDYSAAEKCLIDEGYTTVGSDGIRSGEKGSLRLTLLVNQESGYRNETAECIRQSLAKVGIAAELKLADFETYIDSLKNGSYDLYLGEVKLPNNGDLSAFFGGDVSYGIAESSMCRLSYAELLEGAITMPSFIGSYRAELPFITLGFRNDVLVCGEKITVEESAFCFADCFGNTEKWRFDAGKAAPTEAMTATAP